MTLEEFKIEINSKRKTGKWYSFVGYVLGKEIRLKGYKTYLQIYDVDRIRYGGLMDISVKQFNEELEKPWNQK